MKFTIGFVLSIIFFGLSASAQNACQLLTHRSEVNGNLELEQKNTYNSEGKITEDWKAYVTHYGDAYTQKTIFQYDEKGFLIKETFYRNDEIEKVKAYVYDGRGNIISVTESKGETSQLIPMNKYSLNGNSSEKVFFEKDGSVSGKEIDQKNSDGKLILHQIVNSEGKVNHSSEYTYNAKGTKTYQKLNDVAGNMIEETFYKINENEKVSVDSTFLNNQLIARSVYTYDLGLLKQKSRYGRNNKLDYVINYEYDTKGRNTLEVFNYNGEKLSTVQRAYDANDNLVNETYLNKDNQVVRIKTWEYTCPN